MKYGKSGLCDGHQAQVREGRPLAPLMKRARPHEVPEGCAFEGCDKPHVAKGWCRGHYGQMDRGERLRPLGERNDENWQPTYFTIHNRLMDTQGPARAHLCVICGERRAAHWALHGTVGERVWGAAGAAILEYSLDLGDYSPMCDSCHKAHDRNIRESKVHLAHASCPVGKWNPVEGVPE